jgi:hypothetical protein
LTQQELEAEVIGRSRPHHVFELGLLPEPIGPGMPWPEAATASRNFTLPLDLENSAVDLVLARLIFDQRMAAGLSGFDLAALDTSAHLRGDLVPDGIYVVARRGEAILRYLRQGAQCVYLISADNVDHPNWWEAAPLPLPGILELVKARVVWVGREEDIDLPAHQRGRFLADATSS